MGVTEVNSNDWLDCPFCPNQGWWADADRLTGEPVRVQCEFCYTEPRSKFNNQSNDLNQVERNNKEATR